MIAETFESPFEAYPQILRNILTSGDLVPSRAGDTLEIENATFTFLNSEYSVPPKRPGFSPLLGLMEGMQLVGGFARPKLMDTIWPKYAEYTDHYGDYGERVNYGNQVQYVVNTLKNDPYSRRAIIVLWNGVLDTQKNHIDYPCTLSIGFRVRRGKLNMSVTMRSNDIWRGSSSDFIQFALLHQTVAALINIQPGTYTHTAQSLHLYMSDREIATEWVNANDFQSYDVSIIPVHKPGFRWSYSDVQNECMSSLKLGADKSTMPETIIGQYVHNRIFKRYENLLKK